MIEDLIEVVFCCDQNMLPGLHVTIHSMLSSYASHRPIQITWLHEGVNQRDIDAINATIANHSHNVSLTCIHHGTIRFKDSASLHGSRFPYARLDIPSIIQSDKALYLDSDLIINADISQLFDMNIEEWTIGVPYLDGTVEDSLDREFFVDVLGISPQSPYFNSGVLLMNLRQWRALDTDHQVDTFLSVHGPQCKTCDQTVLNALFHNKFMRLPKYFNQELAPTRPHIGPLDRGIFHFVGRPKPWDVGGRRTNQHAEMWFKVLPETSISYLSSKVGPKAWTSIRASWRSSVKAILSKLRMV